MQIVSLRCVPISMGEEISKYGKVVEYVLTERECLPNLNLDRVADIPAHPHQDIWTCQAGSSLLCQIP